MKRLTIVAGLLILCGSLGRADDSSTDPCKQIVAACKQAGFKMGLIARRAGRGLDKDCVNPIIAGKSVNGVTVDASVVSACQAKKGKTPAAAPTAAPASSSAPAGAQ